jgi:hypothetical protein
MSFQWSFSTDKLFRRCQRQLFFREIAAHPNAKDDWRREAFILKQLKTLELWRGTLIHEGVEKFLVPALRAGNAPPWTSVIQQTLQRAKDQLEFSAQKRYREPGITKGQNDDFCALVPHESGAGVSAEEFDQICKGIRTAFGRLAGLTSLWQRFKEGTYWEAEVPIWLKLPDVSIKVQIDLLLERSAHQFTIIDWKSYELGGDTDARLQTALYGWALLRSTEHKVSRPEDIELLECQVQEGVIIEHAFSPEVVDELDDYIYRSVQSIFSLCQSKKLAEVQLQDFAFTDNPNNCEYCTFRQLCIEMASEPLPIEHPLNRQHPCEHAIPSLF